MAGNPSEEETKFWLKIGLYIFGLSLGLLAKLAELLKEVGASWRDAAIIITRACSIAFAVYFLLHLAGWDNIGMVASVICGIRSKEIWVIVLKWYTTTLKALLGGIK